LCAGRSRVERVSLIARFRRWTSRAFSKTLWTRSILESQSSLAWWNRYALLFET
jgi:hypothetical protein